MIPMLRNQHQEKNILVFNLAGSGKWNFDSSRYKARTCNNRDLHLAWNHNSRVTQYHTHGPPPENKSFCLEYSRGWPPEILMLRNQHQEHSYCSSISKNLEDGNLTHLDTRQGDETTETCILPGATTLGWHSTTHIDPPTPRTSLFA